MTTHKRNKEDVQSLHELLAQQKQYTERGKDILLVEHEGYTIDIYYSASMPGKVCVITSPSGDPLPFSRGKGQKELATYHATGLTNSILQGAKKRIEQDIKAKSK